jgi:hypothetical protein
MDITDRLSQSFERMANKALSRMVSPLQGERGVVVMRGIFGPIAVIVTLYVVKHEFPLLFENDIGFKLLLGVWALYGIIVFYEDYRQARAGTIITKLDNLTVKIGDLINEIKQDRNERKQSK